ncbi:MAG: hypothetical protein ACJ8FD_02045, partial [Bradyrhizobium canariense]
GFASLIMRTIAGAYPKNDDGGISHSTDLMLRSARKRASRSMGQQIAAILRDGRFAASSG